MSCLIVSNSREHGLLLSHKAPSCFSSKMRSNRACSAQYGRIPHCVLNSARANLIALRNPSLVRSEAIMGTEDAQGPLRVHCTYWHKGTRYHLSCLLGQDSLLNEMFLLTHESMEEDLILLFLRLSLM